MLSGGRLQIEADCASGGSLVIASGASWTLHADGDALQFGTVSIGGTPLAAGAYAFADLVVDYSNEVSLARAGNSRPPS